MKSPEDTGPTDTAVAAPANFAQLEEKWAGTWSGSWGGSCTGSIEVSNVTPERANVIYRWGRCDGSRPGSKNTTGRFDGDALVVNLFGRTNARYTHVSPDSLEGVYERPNSSVWRTSSGSGKGIFTRS